MIACSQLSSRTPPHWPVKPKNTEDRNSACEGWTRATSQPFAGSFRSPSIGHGDEERSDTGRCRCSSVPHKPRPDKHFPKTRATLRHRLSSSFAVLPRLPRSQGTRGSPLTRALFPSLPCAFDVKPVNNPPALLALPIIMRIAGNT